MVVVEVSHDHGIRNVSGAGIELPHESAVTLSPENADGIPVSRRYRQIQVAIAIKIADRYSRREGSGGVIHMGLKAAVSFAQQYADRVARLICDRDIKVAVTIEIADRDRNWI